MIWVCEQFRWEIFELRPYRPDLALSGYHLFLHHKKFLGCQGLRSDQETKDVAQRLAARLGSNLINEGAQKLVPWYDSLHDF
jgi:hypothetical protein